MIHRWRFRFLLLASVLLALPGGPAFGKGAMESYQAAINDYHLVKGSDARSIEKSFQVLARMVPQLKRLNDVAAKDTIPILNDLSKKLNTFYRRQDASYGPQICYAFTVLTWNDRVPRLVVGKTNPAIWLHHGDVGMGLASPSPYLLDKPFPKTLKKWGLASSAADAPSSNKAQPLEIMVRFGAISPDLETAFRNIRQAALEREASRKKTPYYIRIESTNNKAGYCVLYKSITYAVLTVPAETFLNKKSERSRAGLAGSPPKPPHYDFVGAGKMDKINPENCHPDDYHCDRWRTYRIACHCFGQK